MQNSILHPHEIRTSARLWPSCVFATLLAMPGVERTHAAPLAYEGFNYAAGQSIPTSSAAGGDGSSGWGGAWFLINNSGAATGVATTMSYVDGAGNILTTSGGSAIVGVPAGTTSNSQFTRSFNLGTPNGSTYSGLTGPGTYWASFIMQWVGPVTAGSVTNQYMRKGVLLLRSGALANATSTGTGLFSVGSPNAGNRIGTPYDTWATWSGNDAAANIQNTGLVASNAPLTVPTFVLMRIDLNGGAGNDTVYTWFNCNSLATEPSIASAQTVDTSANEDGFNNLRIDANGSNATGAHTVLAMDEFRLGNSFADVTPYTSGSSVPPVITQHPLNQLNIPVGSTATFSVTATGSAPLTYQWYFNTNTPLPGKTSATLAFPVSSVAEAGNYSVVVTNPHGVQTSSSAQLTVPPFTAADLPAFSGADGAAKRVSGGRGGTVYHVTKLNSALDDPQRNTPGTLIYGLTSVSGTRTIVFDVAGVFHLGKMDTADWTSGGNAWDATSRQGIGASNITIAGQTAPGPVIIMGGSLKPGGNNQIIRNITIAAGYGMRAYWEPGGSAPTSPAIPTSYTMDAFDVSGQNIMIDHVDTLFTTDEAISCNEFAENLTIQYSFCALGQQYNNHGYGHLLQADTDHKISFLNNLDAHFRSRLPRVGSEVGTGALNDFRNNVIYNWEGSGPGYTGTNQYSKNNFLHNFYLAGDGGDSGTSSTIAGGTGIFNGGSAAYTSVYSSGNLKDTNKDSDPIDTSSADANYSNSSLQSAAYDIDIGATQNASAALTTVLRHSGSRWWERDYNHTAGNTAAIDSISERLVHDVFTGSGRMRSWADDPYNISGTYLADPVNEGAEWRALWALRAINGVAPFNRPAGWDTDGDGIPNQWEIDHGLNPNSASNNADFDTDGYTNLEEYINEIAAWPAPATINFTGAESDRFARIFNWSVSGVPVNITGKGSVTPFSYWQPSKYDTAVINNKTAVVDAIGQSAGILQLTNNATLNIPDGWLKLATRLENGSGCTTSISGTGSLSTVNLVNSGILRLTGDALLNVGGSFTNTGTLDVMTWSGTLPPRLVNSGVILDKGLVKISSVTKSGADFLITMQGYVGHNYQLQSTDNLAPASWQNLGSAVAGANAPITFTHTNGVSTNAKFYRVKVDP
ncbi:MAG: immunoglobulin domain-containing protein [Verrucomicrobiota bacterium]